MRTHEIISDYDFERLLNQSVINNKEELSMMWHESDPMNEFEFDRKLWIQNKVFENLPDPIMMGRNYGQKDIVRKLKNMGI